MASLVRLRVDDAAVMRRAAAGDPAAAGLLDSRYRRGLTRYARSLLGRSHHDAEDVVQDVLVRALEELSAGRGPDELRPWMYRLTRNRAIDELRRARWGDASLDDAMEVHDGEVAESVARTGPHDVAAGRESLRALLSDLADLPVRQRDALLTRVVDGASPEESARRLGVSVGALQMLVVRGRENLRLVRSARERQGSLDAELRLLAVPAWLVPAGWLAQLVGASAGPKVAAGVTAAVVVVAAAGGVQVLRTQHTAAGEPAPFVLSGAGSFVGHRVVRGERVPDGTAVVASTVRIAAGVPQPGSRVAVVQCPSGMRFALLMNQEGGPASPVAVRVPFEAARGDGRVVVSFADTVLAKPVTVRLRVLCRRPDAGGSLVTNPRAPRPGEGRGTVCHEAYFYRDPEHLFLGSVPPGQRVAITRRASRSVFIVTDDGMRGWLKTEALCAGWSLPARGGAAAR